mgnify:CR=1 FL=1
MAKSNKNKSEAPAQVEEDLINVSQATLGEPVTLTVQDLTLCANIIDLSVQRGAFKGAEAETVGRMFTKIVNILKELAPPPAEAEEETKEK